jgi:hypothetical protein
VLRRSKSPDQNVSKSPSKAGKAPEAAAPEHPPVGKGRPTPTRKQAEAANQHPLVGAGRGAGAQMTKEQRRAARAEARARYEHGMRTGEERYLPARDKGPARRFTRDYIDSRRSVGEYFMFLALGMVLVLFASMNFVPVLAIWTMLLFYVVIIWMILDGIIRGRRLRSALRAKFGQSAIPSGTIWYGVSRSFMSRKGRQPKPQVERGQYPS